ncbi:hypothetical protein IAT40_000657 [Kwoniella sp. CBS 6097]
MTDIGAAPSLVGTVWNPGNDSEPRSDQQRGFESEHGIGAISPSQAAGDEGCSSQIGSATIQTPQGPPSGGLRPTESVRDSVIFMAGGGALVGAATGSAGFVASEYGPQISAAVSGAAQGVWGQMMEGL